MEVLEYIRYEIEGMHRAVDNSLHGLTPELFNAATPGTANSINATYVHFLHSEDNMIQKVIQGKPTVWESGGWSGKTGLPKPPGIGEDWSEYKHKQVAIQPIAEYQAAVWAATEAFVAGLKPEDLDRKVKFAGGERSVADVLHLAIAQALGHAGEIAALKGVLGAKGLPI